MKILEGTTLAPLTYYKIGGPARFYCQPESAEDLACVSRFLRENKVPYFILGAGSNILFDDQGFDGLVVHTSKLNRELRHTDRKSVTSGAGVMAIQVLRLCMSEGIEGFEFLTGVPGSMGGVIFMNAGTKTGEAAASVIEVNAFSLSENQLKSFTGADLKYSYRRQHFLDEHDILLGGTFKTTPADPKSVQERIQSLLADRKKSQPIDKPSCGSVFKNPDPKNGVHAWKVIDQAGLRGKKIGSAQISEMHPNFIVNLGGAKSSDVHALIEIAKSEVKKHSGVTLEEEVKIIPFQGKTFL